MITSSRSGGSNLGRRLVALVIAAALIGGAVAVRRLVLDDDGDGDGDDGSARGPLRLACVTELTDACHALAEQDDDIEVTVAAAGDTAATLTAAASAQEVPFDGWLTLAPWPDGVREARVRAGGDALLGADGEVLARSPLALAMRAERTEVLTRYCPNGEITWRCLGDVAGRPWSDLGGSATWGSVKPAHAEPVVSGSGRLVVGQAAGHFLAGPDLAVDDVSRIDWEASDEFSAWFSRLENAVPSDAFAVGADPFGHWLQTRLAAYDVVAGLEAELGPGLAAAPAVGAGARLAYPAPVSTADVVFVPVGSRGERLRERVAGDDGREALATAGWRVDGLDPAAGVGTAPALPDTDGLPAAGPLEALAGYWQEVVR